MAKNKNINFIAEQGKQEVVITSLIKASRERAWKAYTDPRLVPCWWSHGDLATVVDKMTVAPGGEWRFVQRDANGQEYGFHGVYHEILPPERLAFTFEYEARPGHIVKETVNFEEIRGKTRIIDRSEFASVADRDEMLDTGMEEGAVEAMDRLAAMVEELEKTEDKLEKSKPAEAEELSLTREFDAPRDLLWKAWSDPERYKLWCSPQGYSVPYIKIDFCVGHRSLICMRSPEGKEIWSTGVYLEIIPREKIVTTDSFADRKGSPVPASYYGLPENYPMELLLTVSFEEADGKTKLALKHQGFPDKGLADLTKQGWNECLDKLADILKR